MRKILIVFLSLISVAVYAQIPAVQRAGFNLPAGQVPAPNTPGGAVIVFNTFFEGDGAQGLRHFNSVDPFLVFDSAHSLGGGGLCFPVCKVGQVLDGGLDANGNETVFFASYDHSGGGGGLTQGGVYKVTISPVQDGVNPGPVGFNVVAPAFGLAGDLPSALALGPDGNLYVGFLKNGNVKRIVNPYLDPSNKSQVVQSVGGSPNGRPIRAFAFIGADLYIAYSEGLAVIRAATSTACQGGCNAVPVADGFPLQQHVGLTSDGADRLYMAINANGVWRYTVSTGGTVLIATGFAFVAGHTNLMQLDAFGNLWIGDDVSDGAANFSGRIWEVSGSQLALIP